MDPELAQPYFLVNELPNAILEDGPDKEHARRLWLWVNPGQGRPIAWVKQILNTLNIQEDFTEHGPQTIAAETFYGEKKHKILHTVLDWLSRITWQKAGMRSRTMHGLEDLDYEKNTMLWRPKTLEKHL